MYVAASGMEYVLWLSCSNCIQWFYTAQVQDQQLTVPPQCKKNDRADSKPWASATSKESKQSRSYLCEACNVWHTHDQQHTVMGRRILNERYTNRYTPSDTAIYKNQMWQKKTNRTNTWMKWREAQVTNPQGQRLNSKGSVLRCQGHGKRGIIRHNCQVCSNPQKQNSNNADSILKCHGCGKIGVIRPRCPICSNPQVWKSNSAGSILRCHGCGKIGVIQPECPVCFNKPTHKSYSQGWVTVNKLVSASVIR